MTMMEEIEKILISYGDSTYLDDKLQEIWFAEKDIRRAIDQLEQLFSEKETDAEILYSGLSRVQDSLNDKYWDDRIAKEVITEFADQMREVIEYSQKGDNEPKD